MANGPDSQRQRTGDIFNPYNDPERAKRLGRTSESRVGGGPFFPLSNLLTLPNFPQYQRPSDPVGTQEYQDLLRAMGRRDATTVQAGSPELYASPTRYRELLAGYDPVRDQPTPPVMQQGMGLGWEEPISRGSLEGLYDIAPRSEALAALSPGSLMDEPGYIRRGDIFPVTRTDAGVDRIPLPVRALPDIDTAISARLRAKEGTSEDFTTLLQTLNGLQSQLELRIQLGHEDGTDATAKTKREVALIRERITRLQGLRDIFQAEVSSESAQQRALERIEAEQRPQILRDQRQADERQADLRRGEQERAEARGEQQDQRMRNAQMLSTLFPDLGLSSDIMQSGIASDYIPVIVQLAMQRFQKEKDEQDFQRRMTQAPVFLPTVTTA
jgi:hypothetical protein